jgi:hypothetical protein
MCLETVTAPIRKLPTPRAQIDRAATECCNGGAGMEDRERADLVRAVRGTCAPQFPSGLDRPFELSSSRR